jgi:hypothetical protein
MPFTCNPGITMHLITAYKVEEDLQRTWREEAGVKPIDYNKRTEGSYKEEVYH